MAGTDIRNQTSVQEFILLGFPGTWYFQIFLIVVFSVMYFLTIIGNMSIIALVRTYPCLHTPMYFFLCNLSFLEIWYTTASVPKAIGIMLGTSQTISFTVCLLQLFFLLSMGSTECFLLAVMAYDRYLAICHPLHYSSLMNRTFSVHLALLSWLCGFLAISVLATLISRLSFCGPKVINHFLCDIDALIALSCTDTRFVDILSSVVTLVPLLLILVSYTHILRAILRIPSTTGRQKAFSTCSSHLIVVTTFYGTLIVMYVAPSANDSPALNKVFSLLYTTVTPMFNPIIYSLRNQEVREGVKKLLRTMVLKGSKFKITLCK
uniref:Olfactory receptor n=1 Tax=Gopherus evgoodei TaxID=1825980 RepID=A0A8C4WCH8_9SAUR